MQEDDIPLLTEVRAVAGLPVAKAIPITAELIAELAAQLKPQLRLQLEQEIEAAVTQKFRDSMRAEC